MFWFHCGWKTLKMIKTKCKEPNAEFDSFLTVFKLISEENINHQLINYKFWLRNRVPASFLVRSCLSGTWFNVLLKTDKKGQIGSGP